MNATIRDRVARGAALLDEKRPGWDARVDLAVLDLGDCRRCVVGQLFGPEYEHEHERDWGVYGWGLDMLGLNAARFEEYAHGFDIEDFGGREFAALTAEWRRVIAARRLAVRPAQETAAAR
jgi:hypothetical protein